SCHPRGAPRTTLFPYTTLFRTTADAEISRDDRDRGVLVLARRGVEVHRRETDLAPVAAEQVRPVAGRAQPVSEGVARCEVRCRVDRTSTRLNSSHVKISYAVFC